MIQNNKKSEKRSASHFFYYLEGERTFLFDITRSEQV